MRPSRTQSEERANPSTRDDKDSDEPILEDKSKGSSISIESSVNQSVVEVDESQIKWGRGFVENIDTVMAEFVTYREVCPLNVLFVCKEKNSFLLKILKEVCEELSMTLITRRSLIRESAEWESVQNEGMREIYREINTRRENVIEEREARTKAKESRKKKKNDVKMSLEESSSEGIISGDEVSRLLRLKRETDFLMRMRGIAMFDVCDNLRQFLQIYRESFAKKMAYVVEINFSLMKIIDENEQESSRSGALTARPNRRLEGAGLGAGPQGTGRIQQAPRRRRPLRRVQLQNGIRPRADQEILRQKERRIPG